MIARMRRPDEQCRVRRCNAAPGELCLDTRYNPPKAMNGRHQHLVEEGGYCAECDHPERGHEPDPSRRFYLRCMAGRVAPDGGWEYFCHCRRRIP